MKVLIIPDGFKDSLSAAQVTAAIKTGIQDANPDTQLFELLASDGGDGFLNVISHYKPHLNSISCQTTDPLGRELIAYYLYDMKAQAAYVELAGASGIELLTQEERRVMETSTLGTGTVLKNALHQGVKHIYLGLGGSATNDAGMGIAHALGYRFLDVYGNELEPCGGSLNLVAKIIKPEKNLLESVQLTAVNDVQNPLYGPEGAAYTYAKQKGASPLQMQVLDSGLRHLDQQVAKFFGISFGEVPGTGAAGGTAYGLKAFLNAEFKQGTPFMLELCGFHEILEEHKIDLIITGEGRIDHQTKHGKLVSGVVSAAKPFKVPVYAVCGRNFLSDDEASDLGLAGIEQLYSPEQPEGYSFTNAPELAQQRAATLINAL
ncbi:glycerate kinase [Gilvibacter sediminis]|uniref:glycerate kinase n=1 Tax=Gilvibacter sediminis TaxID=379071 RepID=UPI002350D5DA|nr:glycerate kinase [Gilvibacter sediminis]MDC7997813.1 glycerate kinase [Gilvibacter sediminis]